MTVSVLFHGCGCDWEKSVSRASALSEIWNCHLLHRSQTHYRLFNLLGTDNIKINFSKRGSKNVKWPKDTVLLWHSMFRQRAINIHATTQLTICGASEKRVRRRESTGLRTHGATEVSTRCRECWASLDSSLTRPCARSGSNVSTTWRDQRRHRSSLSRLSLSTKLSSSRTCSQTSITDLRDNLYLTK
jgi:hypothetical protein